MVEELDQDLDLFAEGDEEKKKDGPTSVGLKENIKNAGAKSDEAKEKADDDDEVQMEDPSEDVNDDAEEGAKSGDANESTETKLAGAQLAQEEAAEPTPKHDYSLLDMVTAFLYEDTEPLSILCGYFLKIMDQLLDK